MTEKEKIFENIVKDYEKSECFSARLCPDQYVGKIADFKNEDGEVKEDFPVRVNIFAGQTADVCIKFSSYEKIMILIIESPHQKEFYTKTEKDKKGTVIHKKGYPIGPANGPTGTNIRAYIQKFFSVQEFKDKFGSIDQYHLILMNAIPFQCSLGLPLSQKKHPENQKKRDEVFQEVWKKTGRNFLKTRLENLRKDLPDKNKKVFIVNACTSMNGFKAEIQKSIRNITGKDVLQLMHPSVNWSTKTNEQIKAVKSYIENIESSKK